MNVTIHIGSAKTGTTAVQRALYAMRENLADRNVVYKTPDQHFNHNLLSVLFLDHDRWPRAFHGGNPQRLKRRAKKNLSEIVRCVRDGADHVILSGETLFNLPAAAVRRLSRSLARRFEQTVQLTMVVYIAEPATHYLRLSQQKLKASRHILDAQRFRYAFLRTIRSWGDIEGARILAIPYRRDLLTDGCIVRDFSSRVFGESSILGDSITANESLCAESMVVLHDRQLSRPASEENQFTPEIRALIDALFEIEQQFNGRTAPKLRPEISSIVERNHFEDFKVIEAEFGGFKPFLSAGSRQDPGPAQLDSSRELHVRDILAGYDPDIVEAISRKLAENAALAGSAPAEPESIAGAS